MHMMSVIGNAIHSPSLDQCLKTKFTPGGGCSTKIDGRQDCSGRLMGWDLYGTVYADNARAGRLPDVLAELCSVGMTAGITKFMVVLIACMNCEWTGRPWDDVTKESIRLGTAAGNCGNLRWRRLKLAKFGNTILKNAMIGGKNNLVGRDLTRTGVANIIKSMYHGLIFIDCKGPTDGVHPTPVGAMCMVSEEPIPIKVKRGNTFEASMAAIYYKGVSTMHGGQTSAQWPTGLTGQHLIDTTLATDAERHQEQKEQKEAHTKKADRGASDIRAMQAMTGDLLVMAMRATLALNGDMRNCEMLLKKALKLHAPVMRDGADTIENFVSMPMPVGFQMI